MKTAFAEPEGWVAISGILMTLTNGPLSASYNQQISFENIRYEGPSRESLPKESSDTSHVSTRLNSINIEEPNLSDSTINSSSVQELNQETATGRNIGDFGDQGHRKDNDSAANSKRERSRPRKRAREAASNGDPTEENDSSYSIKGPRQKKTKGPPNSVQRSEEIPIHGSFTLREIKSELVYCLPFAQGHLAPAHKGGQRQDISTDSNESQPAVPVANYNQWKMRKVTGGKMIGDKMYYRVDWEPTWEPESELGDAEELIKEYLATLRHAQGVGASSGGEPKKRRGRPRKQ